MHADCTFGMLMTAPPPSPEHADVLLPNERLKRLKANYIFIDCAMQILLYFAHGHILQTSSLFWRTRTRRRKQDTALPCFLLQVRALECCTSDLSQTSPDNTCASKKLVLNWTFHNVKSKCTLSTETEAAAGDALYIVRLLVVPFASKSYC